MSRFGECETCAQSDKRYCVGCQPMRRTDGTYTRTGWIQKPGTTITVTSLNYPPQKGDDDA